MKKTVLTVIGFTFSAFLISEIPVLAQATASSRVFVPGFNVFHSIGFFEVGAKDVERVFNDHLKGVSRSRVPEISRHFLALCKKHRLDPAYVLSLIQVESNFRTRVVSSAGAVGLMQLMPTTAAHLSKKYGLPYRGVASLKDPMINLTLGITYLKELRVKYQGKSAYFHLAAYNMGPSRLDRLSSRPGFKPSQTLKYFENIMNRVDYWRNYASKADSV